MVIQLRKNKETIVDIEIFEKSGNYIEIRGVVLIEPYSRFLLSLNSDQQELAINIFEHFSEIRRWYYEYYLTINEKPSLQEVIEEIKEKMEETCKEFSDLYINID